MKRAWLAAVPSLVLCVPTLAQERIPNPSFEQYTSCPVTSGQLPLAIEWSLPTTGTSDYFNECGAADLNVPVNAVGDQDAFAGSAYAGFIALSPPAGEPNYREYLQAPLLGGALEADKTYRFSMQVSLAEDSSAATDRLGAYFSPTAPSSTDYFALPLTPQVESPVDTFLTDTVEWMEVDGTFVATGGEQYVTIGNFRDFVGAGTTPAGFGPDPPLQLGTAYYYVDVASLTCEPCLHPPDDILAWWPLEELTGPVAADIVLGLDGTHVSGPVPAPGYVGTALELSASGVSVPTSSELERDTLDLSLAAWVRVDALGTSQTLLSKIPSVDPFTGAGYALGVNADGTVRFTMVDAALDDVVADSAVALTAGEWSQVVVGVDRDDSSGGTIWIDAVPTSFDPTGAPGSLTNALPLRFGQDDGAGVGADLAGALDEVQVFARALFPFEVELTYEARTSGQCQIFLELEPVVGIPYTPGTTPTIGTSGTLTNDDDSAGTFTFAAFSEPAGTRCGTRVSTVDGPPNPRVLGPQQVQVPAGGRLPLRIVMDAPQGLGNGLACYSVRATHLETGRSFLARGLVRGSLGRSLLPR